MGRLRELLQRPLLAPTLLVAIALIAACGGSDSSSGQSATPSTPASTTPMSAADEQAARELALQYWAAYNAYDPERAISYLDESYRPSQEETVRHDIGRIKTFGVQLGVSQKSAPVFTGTDQAEMYLNMKTPTGTRTILMRFAHHGSGWTITFVEEVP